VLALVLLANEGSADAGGRRVRRPPFEASDLELEPVGAVDVDTEFGVGRDATSWRIYVPDFEVDIGLHERVELDIDGSSTLIGPDTKTFPPREFYPDHLWISTKLGLYTFRSTSGAKLGTLGLQLGPRFSVRPDAHGIGYEAVALASRVTGPWCLTGNLGYFVDPGDTVTSGRPHGWLFGADVGRGVGAGDSGYVGVGAFGTSYPDGPPDLGGSVTFIYHVAPWLDLTTRTLGGSLGGATAFTSLVGLGFRFQVWTSTSRSRNE
jgi:hypothetical protein